MAELKKENEYLYPLEAAQPQKSNPSTLPLEEPQTNVPLEMPNPQKVPSPLPNIKKISKLEKVIAASLLVTVLLIGFLTMNIGNKMTQIRENTIKVENKNTELEKSIEQLNQEKSELSSAKKVKEVAKKKGLKLKEDNVRTVK